MITPPVGLNLFVIAGIRNRSMGWAISAALPWLGLLIMFLLLITFVPEISHFFTKFIVN
jgi:C4-dicarboxylate transporter DctM subunit